MGSPTTGNHRSARFYQSLGFAEGEQVLYRHLDRPAIGRGAPLVMTRLLGTSMTP